MSSLPSPPDRDPVSTAGQDTAFGTWSWDGRAAEVLVRDASAAAAEHRLTLETWLGLTPETAQAWRDEWQAALDARTGWSRECEVPGADGPRVLLLRAHALLSSATSELAGVWLDVTVGAQARREAERRALAQDARLHLAQEAGGVGAFEWCIEEERVEWSPELERLYGLPPGAFGDRVDAWAEHVHPDDVEACVARVQHALAQKADGCDFEFRALLPSGAVRWLEGRVRFSYAPDGRPLRMIGVNTDIDARKRSEVALRESEAWFRHLAEALPLMIWAAAPDGLVDYVNEAWRRYAGPVDAPDWLRVVHPEDVGLLETRWRTSISSRQQLEARARLRRAEDGQYRWHTVRALPLEDPGGALVRWVGAFIDEHELRTLVEANQQLLASEQRARQAAEDAGRTRDEFLATLGHELRTPLNAIVGWTNLLRRGDLGAPERTRAIEVIERNAEAQRRLLDELLDVSRVVSGHVRLELQAVPLGDLLQQALEAVRPLAEARSLRLHLEGERSAPTLQGDAARLQQVFANLLGNAVKFTPDGGRIDVVVEPHADEVTVHVRDTGVGIAPAFVPHVFDRFRQAHSAGPRTSGGLGLGLAIVKQIVQMHGGRVTAESRGEGAGATFSVSLPLSRASDAPPAAGGTPRPVEGGAAALRGLSILVIEDDPDSREMLSVLLENAGGVPVAAASVTEGLRLLGDLEIDVVLSDIGMPDRDGFDLIRSLRMFPNPRVRRAPALAVTAFTRQEDRHRILTAGFDAHVSKPVEPSELFATIADVVRRHARQAGSDAGPRNAST